MAKHTRAPHMGQGSQWPSRVSAWFTLTWKWSVVGECAVPVTKDLREDRGSEEQLLAGSWQLGHLFGTVPQQSLVQTGL